MLIDFYGHSVLVGGAAVKRSVRSGLKWKAEVEQLIRENAIVSNGYCGVVRSSFSGSEVCSFLIYLKGESHNKPVLANVLMHAVEAKRLSNVMFVLPNTVISISNGAVIDDFASVKSEDVVDRAHVVYSQSFVDGCIVFSQGDIFPGAENIDSLAEYFTKASFKRAMPEPIGFSRLIKMMGGVLLMVCLAAALVAYEVDSRQKARAAAERARLEAERNSPQKVYERFEADWMTTYPGCLPDTFRPLLSKFLASMPFDFTGWKLKTVTMKCREKSGGGIEITAKYSREVGGTNAGFVEQLKVEKKFGKFDLDFNLEESALTIFEDVSAPPFNKEIALPKEEFMVKVGSSLQHVKDASLAIKISSPLRIDGLPENQVSGNGFPVLKSGAFDAGFKAHHWRDFLVKIPDFLITEIVFTVEKEKFNTSMKGQYVIRSN